jgi:uncharacterized integral membrane protein
MRTQTPATPVRSPVPGVIPEPITGSVGDGAPAAREPKLAPAHPPAQTGSGGETRGGRFRRKARRTRLHGYAIATVVLVAYLIALAASNTAHVKVSWVFGTSHVSLVWLVLFAALLGWLLALATSARFHWLTRAPRRRRKDGEGS